MVTVTFWAAVDCPPGSAPNDKLVDDRVSDACGALMPVPLRVTDCGELGAPSVMVTAAVAGPKAVGTKRTPKRQVAPAGRLVPQLFEVTNDVAFAPVSLMIAMAMAELVLLVK